MEGKLSTLTGDTWMVSNRLINKVLVSLILIAVVCCLNNKSVAQIRLPYEPWSIKQFLKAGGYDIYRVSVTSSWVLSVAPPKCRYAYQIHLRDKLRGDIKNSAILCAGKAILVGGDYLISAYQSEYLITRYQGAGYSVVIEEIKKSLKDEGVPLENIVINDDSLTFRMYSIKDINSSVEDFIVIPESLISVPDECIKNIEITTTGFSDENNEISNKLLHIRWECFRRNISNILEEKD